MMDGCMWMCVRERERDLYHRWYDGWMHVDVCVRERERERERDLFYIIDGMMHGCTWM